MEGFKRYQKEDIAAFVKVRDGEIRLGQQIAYLNAGQDLESSPAKFVLLGIPEDIGISANYGIRGSSTAWNATLNALLNTQSNSFFPGEDLLLLGHFEFYLPTDSSRVLQMEKVAWIDEQIYPLIRRIITAGKIPVVIGGGHNNAYPIIKGTSIALDKKINVVNIDAHADLRTLDGRHSGNGFSYALSAGYLAKYAVFGLQQNYLNSFMLNTIMQNSNISVKYFEDLLLTPDIGASFKVFVEDMEHPLGLEIDMDTITGVLSSAATPSGIHLNTLRAILLSLDKKCNYLHICEAAATLIDGRQDLQTGKTISYLITDFVKSQRSKY